MGLIEEATQLSRQQNAQGKFPLQAPKQPRRLESPQEASRPDTAPSGGE